MEHCGGGSVSDLLSAGGQPLEEDMIAHICCEALKVGLAGWLAGWLAGSGWLWLALAGSG